MNKFLKHIEKETKLFRLSDAEKSSLRARLHEAMEISTQPRAANSTYYQWFFAPRSFAFALVLVVLAGGGTTYAAEGALPGDVLYPVKIHVNERVETALALTPQSKVAVNTKLAQRRIAEVQTLATRGTLDATTTAQAEANFDYHTAQVAVLAHEKNNKARSREDRSTFSAKISASLGVEDNATGTVEAATVSERHISAPARKDKEQSAKENSDHFEAHVRARVQTILDLEVSDDTGAPTTISKDSTSREHDTRSGRGEQQ